MHNVPFTLIKLVIRKSKVSQSGNQKAVVQELDSCLVSLRSVSGAARSAGGGYRGRKAGQEKAFPRNTDPITLVSLGP